MLKKYLNRNFYNLVFVTLLPIFFYIAVSLLVANNSHPICLFKILTGHDCWGCGMTRAFNSLFELNFQKAFEFNPRIIIVAPLLFWVWLTTLIRAIKEFRNSAEAGVTND